MNLLLKLLLLSGFAVSSIAQGSIAYYEGPSPIPYQFGSTGIDFDADGSPEFVLWNSYTYCTMDVPTSGCCTFNDVATTGATELLVSSRSIREPLVLKTGEEIKSVAALASVWEATRYSNLVYSWWSLPGRLIDGQTVHDGWEGPLASVTNGFLGIRFRSVDGFHYGWIQISLPDQWISPIFIGLSPVILGWGYETRPNIPIRAGAKPTIALQALPEIARSGFIRLRWLSEVGVCYQVQTKQKLTKTSWTNLDLVIVANGTDSAADIPLSTSAAFFRVVEAD